MLNFIILLTLIGISPFPALPYIIYFYSKTSFYESLIIIIISNILITFIQYNFGKYAFKKNFLPFKSIKKINLFINKFKQIKTHELILIRFSNIFITKIINILSGYLSISFKKILIINLTSIFIWHFLYFYLSKKIDLIGMLFKDLGLNISITNIISIITLSSLIYLTLKVFKIIILKILKKKDLYD